jgi:gas vesicle protein
MNKKYWIIGGCIGITISGIIDRIFFKPKRDREQQEFEERMKRESKEFVDSIFKPKIEEAKKDWDKIINSGEPIHVDEDFDVEEFKKELHKRSEEALQRTKARVERLKMSADKLCLDFNEMENIETIDGKES